MNWRVKITTIQAKTAMINKTKITCDGITYSRILAIITRIEDNAWYNQIEMVDKNKNSVCVADIMKVEVENGEKNT